MKRIIPLFSLTLSLFASVTHVQAGGFDFDKSIEPVLGGFYIKCDFLAEDRKGRLGLKRDYQTDDAKKALVQEEIDTVVKLYQAVEVERTGEIDPNTNRNDMIKQAQFEQERRAAREAYDAARAARKNGVPRFSPSRATKEELLGRMKYKAFDLDSFTSGEVTRRAEKFRLVKLDDKESVSAYELNYLRNWYSYSLDERKVMPWENPVFAPPRQNTKQSENLNGVATIKIGKRIPIELNEDPYWDHVRLSTQLLIKGYCPNAEYVRVYYDLDGNLHPLPLIGDKDDTYKGFYSFTAFADKTLEQIGVLNECGINSSTKGAFYFNVSLLKHNPWTDLSEGFDPKKLTIMAFDTRWGWNKLVHSMVGSGDEFPPPNIKVLTQDANLPQIPQAGSRAPSIRDNGEILSENGHVIEIKKTDRGDAIQGVVESLNVDHGQRKITLSGWTADVRKGKAPQKVALFYKNKFIGEGTVNQPSASIIGHYAHYNIPGNYGLCGFNITVFSGDMTIDNPNDIQVVAFGEDGDANFVYLDKGKIHLN